MTDVELILVPMSSSRPNFDEGPVDCLATTQVMMPTTDRSCPTIPEAFDMLRALEAYAELVVDLYALPYSTEEVMAKYRIESHQELAALHALWQERLGRDPKLRQAWVVLRTEAARRWSRVAA
jgi:hypothetical protein